MKRFVWCLVLLSIVTFGGKSFANSGKGKFVKDSLQSKYFPLAKGNQWEYKRTLFEGRKVFSWEAYTLVVKGYNSSEKEGETTFTTISRGSLPQQSEETYSVKDQAYDENGIPMWEIEISSPTARDGRYEGLTLAPDTILWGRVPSGEGVIEIGEILISEHFFAGKRKHKGTLLVEPLAEEVEARMQPMGLPVEFITSAKLISVTVPAGRFHKCLQMITKVKVKGDDKIKSWTTYSYYAPKVGLVKEVQKNNEDKETYTLELIRYNLH